PGNAEKDPVSTATSAQMHAPATIDGVDSGTSATNRTVAASGPRPYSARYTADSTPSGTAVPVAMPTMMPVPMNDCSMPPPGRPGGAGVFVKNAPLSAPAPFATT